LLEQGLGNADASRVADLNDFCLHNHNVITSK
jgi:hypothetical protein